MGKEVSDPVITHYVQGKIDEGYQVVKKFGTDLLRVCPKCRSGYFYTFKKGNEILMGCPFCKHN